MAFDVNDLTSEQILKGMSCKTLDEFQAFIKDQGFDLTEDEAQAFFEEMYATELTEEELDAVAGGGWCNKCETLECTDYVCEDHLRTRKKTVRIVHH